MVKGENGACSGLRPVFPPFFPDRYGNRGMQGDVGIPAPAPLCALRAAAGGPSTCNSSTTAWTPAYNAADNRLNTNWALYEAGNIVYWKDPVAASPWTAAYNGENKQRFYCARRRGVRV